MNVVVCVPTYNEAANLEELLARTRTALPDARCLIVDDASPDGTGALAERLAGRDPQLAVLHRSGRLGLGSAYLDAFAYALGQGADTIVEMDADLSHDPADLSRLVGTLAACDLAIGSRYQPTGAVVDWSWHRRLLSRAGNRYVQVVTGAPLADATSGYRAFRAPVLRAIDLHTVRSEGYCFQIDLALRAWRLGFRVVEVPITFTERQDGSSKISRRIVGEAVLRTAWWGLRGPRGQAAPHPDSVARAPDFADTAGL